MLLKLLELIFIALAPRSFFRLLATSSFCFIYHATESQPQIRPDLCPANTRAFSFTIPSSPISFYPALPPFSSSLHLVFFSVDCSTFPFLRVAVSYKPGQIFASLLLPVPRIIFADIFLQSNHPSTKFGPFYCQHQPSRSSPEMQLPCSPAYTYVLAACSGLRANHALPSFVQHHKRC
jgi:hypothetical protein